MAYRRIAYAALLGGAVLFQIVFRFYLSTFTLALVLLLPLLSVLLSLPSVLGCTLLLTSAAPTVVQGEDAVFQVRLRSRTRLPLPRLQARLHWSNQLTGAGGRVRWEPVRTAPGAPPTLELATPHCGRLICRAERAWTCDLLGLFPLPIPTGRPAAVLILPPDMEQGLPERLLGGGPGGGALLPRPGGGFFLRRVRNRSCHRLETGDPLRSVHWKLSSKRDELVVRETLEPRQTTLVLTYDHFGAPAALDQTFARLCALSRALLERGRPHHIQWASPTGGGVEGRLVDSERALLACLELAFSRPARSMNSSLRAVYSMVPPRWMMSDTLRRSISTRSPLIRPLYPRYTPYTCTPLLKAVRTTARTAAFMPGASPPLVSTASFLIDIGISLLISRGPCRFP